MNEDQEPPRNPLAEALGELAEATDAVSEAAATMATKPAPEDVWFAVDHDGERIEVHWRALDQVNGRLLELHGRYLVAEDVEQLIRDQIAQGHWPMPGVE